VRKTLRASDEVARFAGDEFVGIAASVTSTVAPSVVAKVRTALTFESHAVKGRSMPVSASVGVALFPDDGHDVPTLLRKADQAMYAMKVALGTAHASRKPR